MQEDRKPSETKPVRVHLSLKDGCPTCERYTLGDIMPPHDASPRCESGKRNHCSCDVCF